MVKVTAIAAISVDGKIAVHSNQRSDWTSREDKQFLRSKLAEESLVVVGNNTYKASLGPLSSRNCLVFSRSVQGTKKASDLLTYCNPESPDELKALLEKCSQVFVLGGAQVYSYFLDHDLLTDLYLTIEPVVFGRGLSLFGDEKNLNTKLSLESSRALNDHGSLLLHYLCNTSNNGGTI